MWAWRRERPPVLTINLTRMRALIDLDKEAQLATFGAGVLGPDLEAQLRAFGYTLGHFPQSFEYSTLGGWVVTRSSGQQSLRYGRIEQLFAGGRVETPPARSTCRPFPRPPPEPTCAKSCSAPKGGFGILTEATVRVSRLPQYEAFHAVFFPDWESAAAATRELAQAKLPLSMLRLSNPLETLDHADPGRAQAPDRRAGNMAALARLRRRQMHADDRRQRTAANGNTRCAPRCGRARRRRRARGPHYGRQMEAEPPSATSTCATPPWEQGYAIDTVETAVDWPGVTPMMHALEQAATQAMAACGERVHAYTHLSHLYAQGASVYTTFVYRLSGNYEEDLQRWRRLKSTVSEAIIVNGGTISHQHGVGTDHAPYLASEKGLLGMSAMRTLFRHFDPDGRMNPGKLVSP